MRVRRARYAGRHACSHTWSRSVGNTNGRHPSHPRRRPLAALSAHDTTDGSMPTEPLDASPSAAAAMAVAGELGWQSVDVAAGMTDATVRCVGRKRPEARKRDRMSSASAR